jgi:hypothetical protein
MCRNAAASPPLPPSPAQPAGPVASGSAAAASPHCQPPSKRSDPPAPTQTRFAHAPPTGGFPAAHPLSPVSLLSPTRNRMALSAPRESHFGGPPAFEVRDPLPPAAPRARCAGRPLGSPRAGAAGAAAAPRLRRRRPGVSCRASTTRWPPSIPINNVPVVPPANAGPPSAFTFGNPARARTAPEPALAARPPTCEDRGAPPPLFPVWSLLAPQTPPHLQTPRSAPSCMKTPLQALLNCKDDSHRTVSK